MEHVRSKGAPLSYHCAKHVLLVAGILCSTLQPSAKTADLLAHPALEQEVPNWEAKGFQVICGAAISACRSAPSYTRARTNPQARCKPGRCVQEASGSGASGRGEPPRLLGTLMVQDVPPSLLTVLKC